MECSRYRREISRLLDGELDHSSVLELEHHLKDCEECRRVQELMTGLNEGLLSVGVPSPRPGLATAVKERIAEERSRSGAGLSIPGWARAALFALIIISALGVGNIAGRSVEQILAPNYQGLPLDEIVVHRSPSFADALVDLSGTEKGR